MFMRTGGHLFIIAAAAILLCGCSSSDPAPDCSAMLIAEDQYLYTDENFSAVQTAVRRKDEGLNYFGGRFLSENDKYYFTQTSANRRNNSEIALIDKSSLEIIRKEGNYYAQTIDDQYCYGVEVLPDQFIIHRFDFSLKETESKTFSDYSGIAVVNQILSDSEKIYLLVGIVPSDAPYGTAENHLYILDDSMNLMQDIDLGLYDGSYTSMEKAGNHLYLCSPARGYDVATYSAYPNNELAIFDLDSQSITSTVSLELSAPESITVCGAYLVIDADPSVYGSYAWDIYSPDDGSHHLLQFPDNFETQPQTPFALMHDDKCYFVFQNRIETYDPSSGEQNTITLSDSGSLSSLFFRN
ncbi:MAG: hypothetical protein ACI4WR_05465 [Bulleidia sp.]